MQAGWYPDPVGVHELRYHNGSGWTGDVSTEGIRRVSALPDPSAPSPPARSDPRSGMVAMVFGIISMSIGWIPFVCFVAAFFSLAAIVIGIRRRRFESARSAATAGIVTGAVGLLLSAAGIWVSVIIVQAVASFEDPGPHRVELIACEDTDGVTRASGSVTNESDRERTYTITLSFDGERQGEGVVTDVGAGETRDFIVDEDLRFAELDCSIVNVKGPRPFGLAQ